MPARPLRVALFTDTLVDVNGVARFIRNVAAEARRSGRDLQVVTSTRATVPEASNITNFKPLLAGTMPGYPDLEWAVPPFMQLYRWIGETRPDVIHVSTPGFVGMVGRIGAKLHRIPVAGVYHTDFPAYIDHLFNDASMTRTCEAYMRLFYRSFAAIFSRSREYVDILHSYGIDNAPIHPLRPGIDLETFNRSFRDPSIWKSHGVPADAFKVLYVGRVSVEKNLPLLAGIWKDTRRRLHAAGVDAHLILVGDGPYRAPMEADLNGENAHFLGFRHGAEPDRASA
jgi:glycosyltransferase involved in cell wall biosynthesis